VRNGECGVGNGDQPKVVANFVVRLSVGVHGTPPQNMKAKLLTAASLILAAVLGYLLFQSSIDRHRGDAELAEARVSIEKLQAELSNLKSAQISEADLARLKADQREAIKLRGEVSSLKQLLAAAQKAASDAKRPAAAPTPMSIEPAQAASENPDVRTFNSKINARLPANHGLALGGWQTYPGKRAFAILVPNTVAAAPGANQQVDVVARWIEVSDDAAARLQLDTLLNATGNQSSILAPNYLQQFVQTVESTEGAKIVSSPRVITNSGQEATVSVTSIFPTGAGPVNIGPELRITPTLTPDSSGIDLSINATLNLPARN
jgi:hypothetical protein